MERLSSHGATCNPTYSQVGGAKSFSGGVNGSELHGSEHKKNISECQPASRGAPHLKNKSGFCASTLWIDLLDIVSISHLSR